MASLTIFRQASNNSSGNAHKRTAISLLFRLNPHFSFFLNDFTNWHIIGYKLRKSNLTEIMRKILVFILASLTPVTAFTQQRVNAHDILREIDDGKSVSYKDVEIEGTLDFTDLRNRRLKDSSFSLFGNNNDLYESAVEAPVTFINCTFLDDVIAYYHLERNNNTYIAHFEDNVVFKNCTFKRKSEFKYSEFSENVDFSGSIFNRDANFKYAEFSELPYFNEAEFRDEANFKYAEFTRGANFESAIFLELANFKYTKFRTPVNFKNISFEGYEDFKYTKVDGRSFTSYLLKNR